MDKPMDSYDVNGAPSLRDRLVFLFRGGMTKRFHAAAVLKENSVAHHSWGVAWLCYLLTGGKASRQLILAALAHDMAEQITSDVSAPAKRMLGIREMLHKKENEVLDQFDFKFEDGLEPEEANVLTLADSMDGLLYCVQERMFGNSFIKYQFDKFYGYISAMCDTSLQKDVLASILMLWEDAIAGPYNESQ